MLDLENILKVPFIKKYIGRIKIDILTKSYSDYKRFADILKEFVDFNFENDYPSVEFLHFIKKAFYELETIVVTMRKLIKNDVSILEDMKRINLRVYYILNELYEYNILDFQEILREIENGKFNYISLYKYFELIFKKVYLFSRVELTSEEKSNISRIFPKITNYNRSFVFFAFTKLCVLTKKVYNYDDKFITFNFGRMCDSFAYLFDFSFFQFLPLIYRYLGYNYISFRKNRDILFYKVDELLDIKEKIQEFRDLPPFIEEDEVYEEDETEKIIRLPDDVLVSIDLFSYFFNTNIFNYLQDFPDYIDLGYKFNIIKGDLYKRVSNEDNINFFIFFLKLVSRFIPYLKNLSFKDSGEYSTILDKFAKIVYDYENFIEKNYLKILVELQNLLKVNETFEKNEFLKRLSDELNFLKKKFIYPNYYYHHYTGIALSDSILENFYERLNEVYVLFSNHLKYLDRRTQSENDIAKYFINYKEKVEINKDDKLFKSLKEAFPETDESQTFVNLNLFFIFFHILNIFNYFINSKSSIFNFYPSNKFIKQEEKLLVSNNVTIQKKEINENNSKKEIESSNISENFRTPDYFYYKKMSYKINMLEKTAYIDSLTNCYNKNFFTTNIVNNNEIDKNYIFLYFDLDNFKYFNDNYGHSIGDLILKYFGNILIKSTRKNDFAIRLGGDEFLVIAKTVNLANSYILAKRIVENLNTLNKYILELLKFKGKKAPEKTISCSVGGVFFENTVNETIELADKVMYKAKEAGKNKICIYSKERGYQYF
ncbi:MAG: GGDEF domain-containing protein [Spirochaetes bacterium]|nr:GGDEF domain-containing protein [Spirochaetota bacterium]